MSNFFKILLGSCLGTILALVVLFFVGFSAIVGLAASAGEDGKPSVESNSILTLDVAGAPELTNNQAPDGGFELSLKNETKLGLHDMINVIEHAATDDKIKGIYLNNFVQSGGFTKLRQVRDALIKFQESGKFVVTYAPSLDQSAYYLGSVSDEIYIGPLGAVDFRGFGAEVPFYKKMLDKAGVQFQVFYAGDFKGATEPFRFTELSDSNRLQTRQYLNGMWDLMVADVAAARGVSEEQVRGYANNLTGWRDQAAVDAGIVDGILRRSEVDARLHELVGFDPDEKLRTLTETEYFEAKLGTPDGFGSDQVAVLFAEGGIIDGKAEPGGIGDKNYVKEIDQLAEDDDIKAVVLRVNSGGGSASASENIWYAAEKLKETGKPFVVSMGSVAASGGYYIAAGADSIFAEPSTITGSIGVFMMFPIVEELMSDKIGITFDTVNTARHSNAFSPFRTLGNEERDVLKTRTSMIYETFLDRVAAGRPGLDKEDVRKIASGRVYTGVRAQEIGLVDHLGGLDDAVACAARMAGLDDENIYTNHFPKMKTPIEQFIEKFVGADGFEVNVAEGMAREQLGPEHYEHFRLLRQMSQVEKPQCVLPVVVRF